MKELNQLENRLRSWIPRSPSPNLRSRLFPLQGAELETAAAATERSPAKPADLRWQWLAPAMALFIVSMTFFSRHSTGFTPFIASPAASLVATVALNEPHLATYYAAATHSEHNVWPITTFEWTNGSHTLSTAPPVLRTNGLLP